MTKITIGGVQRDIPPFKLRELRAAAPYIDRVLSQRRNLSALQEGAGVMESLTSTLGDTLSVVAVGVLCGLGDRPYTAEKIARVADDIEGELSLEEINMLNPLFNEILSEAGMKPARPTMPGEGTSTSLSASESNESSQSSLPQDAPVETGTE